MSDEITADYCIAGGGIAGLLVASKLAATGKRIVVLEQGPRYSEQNRVDLMIESQETLNDGADYNDDLDEAARTPHTTAGQNEGAVEWSVGRLFGVGGTALHFEGLSQRPRADDLRVKTLYGYGRDWPITFSELEPWLLRAEQELGVAGNDDNPYVTALRSVPDAGSSVLPFRPGALRASAEAPRYHGALASLRRQLHPVSKSLCVQGLSSVCLLSNRSPILPG